MKILTKLNNTYKSYGKRIISIAFVLMLAFCVLAPLASHAATPDPMGLYPTAAPAPTPYNPMAPNPTANAGGSIIPTQDPNAPFASYVPSPVPVTPQSPDTTLGDEIINILYGPTGLSGSQIDSVTGAVTGVSGGTIGLMDIVKQLVTPPNTNPLGPFALSLVALFFVIETLNKSVSFEKITIEMVIKLLIRLLIAKILVDNASWILVEIDQIIIKSTGSVMSGITNSINTLKAGNANYDVGWGVTNVVSLINDNGLASVVSQIGTVFGVLLTTVMTLGKGGMGSLMEAAGWVGLVAASHDLLGMLGGGDTSVYTAQELLRFGVIATGNRFAYIPVSPAEMSYYIWLGIMVVSIAIRYVVQAVIWIQIYITLILRSIEMLILAYLAPIAMAAFVSDEFKATTKKFLLNFATICLQGMVIVVICKVVDIIFVDKLTLANFNADIAASTAPIPGWLTALGGDKGPGYIMYMLVQSGIYDMWGQSWGFLEPLKMLFINIFPMIVVSILVGKSRSIAQSLIGG